MSKKLFVVAVAMVLLGTIAYAELQNVEVGGKIRIRGSWLDYDNDSDIVWTEQRTRLNVKADFTDEVTAFIELDSYDIWGEDFRSRDYVTGVDSRQVSTDDVEVYQAYIEAREMWGTPLRLRVGRQEMTLGSGWLVGTNDKRYNFTGLSWDAVRLGYVSDTVTVDAFMAKLAENFSDFFEDDVDFYGVYGSYTGLEDIVIDAYWLYLRDDAVRYKADLHTVGLRGAGKVGAFDFEAEVAYQFGDKDDCTWWIFGVDRDFNAWGVNLEVGYTFDISWQPRVYAGFAYLEGDDYDCKWFDVDEYDYAFNRLFSNWEYSDFLDDGGILTNAFVYRLGVGVQPTEAIKLGLEGQYYVLDEDIVRGCLWWRESNDELGWEIQLTGAYQYSEDLVFRAGYSHFFGEEVLEDLDFNYLFAETEISF